jgi:hypothetical protein
VSQSGVPALQHRNRLRRGKDADGRAIAEPSGQRRDPTGGVAVRVISTASSLRSRHDCSPKSRVTSKSTVAVASTSSELSSR